MDHEIIKRIRMISPSRRHFLKATAIAGGLTASTTLDVGSIAGIATAGAAAADAGDLGILNFALTLEHLELALYRLILNSGLLTGTALAYGNKFASNESTQVQILMTTIPKLGGTPVKAQSRYNFPAITTQAQAIEMLRMFEDVGASAYLGGAPLIKNPDILTTAVQFHTVEAEHATGWRFLAGENPVPFDFATPRTAPEVLAIVAPFLNAPATSGSTPASGAGTPSSLPNTGAGDNDGLKVVSVVGGLAAVAAGAALLRGRHDGVAEQE